MKLALRNSTLMCFETAACIGLIWLSGCQLQPPSTDSQAIGKGVPPDAPTVSRQVVASNALLGSEITRAFSRDSKLKGSNIGVSVSNLNGQVTLIGTVLREEQRKQALQIAEKLATKKNKTAKVLDQLTIQASVSAAKAKNKVKIKSQ